MITIDYLKKRVKEYLQLRDEADVALIKASDNYAKAKKEMEDAKTSIDIFSKDVQTLTTELNEYQDMLNEIENMKNFLIHE